MARIKIFSKTLGARHIAPPHFSQRPVSQLARGQRCRRLTFEPLEERRVLTTFTVTNLNDATVSGPGSAPGTLRQAIYDANASSDVDVMWLHGFGFPRYRGGLMFWADNNVGSKEVLRQIEEWHQRYGDRWKPSAYLREIGEAGGSFREAKPKKEL